MKDTCCLKSVFFASLLDKVEQCPNYIEGWWKPLEGEPEMFKDCAPKRTHIMVQDLYNRLIGLQQTAEQERNKSHEVTKNLIKLFEHDVIVQKDIEHQKKMITQG